MIGSLLDALSFDDEDDAVGDVASDEPPPAPRPADEQEALLFLLVFEKLFLVLADEEDGEFCPPAPEASASDVSGMW